MAATEAGNPLRARPSDNDEPDISSLDESGGADLLQMAYAQRERGDYTATLATVREGLAQAERSKNAELKASFLYVSGRTYWALADFTKAIEQHFEELRIADDLGNPRLQAEAHHGLGVAYGSMRDGETALMHARMSVELAEKAGDKKLLAFAHNGLGNVCMTYLKDFDQARFHHSEALKLRREIKDERGIADSYINLGIVEENAGNGETALTYMSRAADEYARLNLPRHLANSHWRKARVLQSLGRNQEALAELDQALKGAEALGSKDILASVYRGYAYTYEACGNYQEALRYERLQTEADAALRGIRAQQRTSELQARYDSERREHEIARLRGEQALQAVEMRKRRFQILSLIALMVVGLVVLGAVIFVQRTRIAVERRLREATDVARKRAEEAERLKSRLLLIASHDLKTPLAAATELAEKIADNPGDQAQVGRFAEGIRADTRRMGSLVRAFLDAAAIEEGRLHLHQARLDLAAVAHSAVEGLLPLAQRKQQTIEIKTAATPICCHADEERIRQILDNLLGNALKFTPVGGVISVSVSLGSKEWAEVAVADSGPGLRAEDLMKIFRPFESLSAKPTGGESSSGLGLFIARELLAAHGGRLEVESQPGKGAVFRILLPVAGC